MSEIDINLHLDEGPLPDAFRYAMREQANEHMAEHADVVAGCADCNGRLVIEDIEKQRAARGMGKAQA